MTRVLALWHGEFFAEGGDFGFGCGAGFAFALDDFDGAEDFLFECLELVCADTRADGGCTHISTSIDGRDVDLAEGNRGGIYLGARFCRIKIVGWWRGDFQGVWSFGVVFDGESWWTMVNCGEFVVVRVVAKNFP